MIIINCKSNTTIIMDNITKHCSISNFTVRYIGHLYSAQFRKSYIGKLRYKYIRGLVANIYI